MKEERHALIFHLVGLLEQQEKSKAPQIFVQEISRVSKLLKELYKKAKIKFRSLDDSMSTSGHYLEISEELDIV